LIYDLAIVGYGPTGATLANLLGMQGLTVAVLEREPGLVPLPRAVHFDGEVMRIFETAGLASQLLSNIRPSGGMRYVNTSGTVMIERRPAGEIGPHGWANNYLFHQPDFENVLRAGAERYPNVEVFKEHEVLSLSQSEEEVLLKTQNQTLRARWVVGCDGARSIVRQAIGSGHHDLGLHQPWLVVDVLLERDVDLPEQTVQYCDPARPVTFVKVTGRRRRWEIMLMPGDDPDTIERPESMWRLLAPWIRPGDARIERSAVYTFHSLIAKRWRDRRLFIAGDAAHQTPPFLGQGMCSGIRDAANLAWKLGREVKGPSSASLLDTYQSEREEHVRVFIDTAVRLGNIIQTTDPKIAVERDRRFREGGKEEMVNLSPPLGPGFHLGKSEIFPQPVLPDGRRLDAAIAGYRFALLSPWKIEADVAVVPYPGDEAILLRPDRYVYGVARSKSELSPLLAGASREPRAAESHH
jgi:3-(3-hydroxy-phenyl)propionate hydroxylase